LLPDPKAASPSGEDVRADPLQFGQVKGEVWSVSEQFPVDLAAGDSPEDDLADITPHSAEMDAIQAARIHGHTQ
jgi:hypothetical protein